MSKVFSMRAECETDTTAFFALARQQGFGAHNVHLSHVQSDVLGILPDVKVQFECDATLEQLQHALHSIVDSHVMLETLRACALCDNSLERHWP